MGVRRRQSAVYGKRGALLTHSIVRTETPEEREYVRYLAAIDARKRCVAELQADLAAHKEQLGRFNAEHHAAMEIALTCHATCIDRRDTRSPRCQRLHAAPPGASD